ncbi:GAF and ANTAR domain-containing protein [Speluncibacter jeojiensis]|uniref:GAF and ANTAR domain-containing protein n=2 Tax=Speluncibacter jeojiensis TaxID=2710754 RepID=A0A9X4RF52_9ACTN|nr:GAF and ANTAR domain-containing protein [Corynebacteriales bacterium D3-21]
MSDDTREAQVVRALVEMADTLVDDYDVADLLHQLVQHCVGLLDVAAAGLVLADQRGGLQVLAASSERTRLLELFQLQSNQGPCLECFRSGEPVLVADLAAQTVRWPSFASEAHREGFASVHAVPLRLRKQTIGALNLFGNQPGSLTAEDLVIARALADTATIGILQERAIARSEILTEQLQTALNSRITIEQAKGVLASAGNLDMEQAFEALRGHARRHSSRLSEIAHRIVTGDLDPAELLHAARTHRAT